jgi:hypothetical protein
VFAVSADDVREAGKEFQSSREKAYLVNTSSACVCVCVCVSVVVF